MNQQVLAIKINRFKLGVGTKTLAALSFFFWVPVTILVAILFLLFQGVLENEATTRIKLGLNGAAAVYEERGNLLRELLPHLAQNPALQQAVREKDSDQTQALLLEFGKKFGFVTILAAVDEDRRVIARRGSGRGEILQLGEVVSRAILMGRVSSATELVSKEFLIQENVELANLINDVGLVQFVVVPVRQEERFAGAVVGGILLTADAWLGDNVLNRMGVDFTLFAGKPAGNATLHTTSSQPRGLWKLGHTLPERVGEEVALGRPFYGLLALGDTPVIAAFEPIKDSRHRIIGAMGVSTITEGFDTLITLTLGKGVAIAALIGLVISLVVTFFIRNDIIRPLGLLVEGMDRFGRGELGITMDIRTGDQFEQLGEGFNAMVLGVFKREERLKKHNAIAKLLMSTLNLNELLEKTLEVVIGISDSQIGAIYLWDEGRGRLMPQASYGTQKMLQPLYIGEGYPGRAAQDKQILIVPLAEDIPDAKVETGFIQYSPKEIAYLPLTYQERLLGVLVLGSVEPYQEDEVELFEYLGNQISIALDNAIMHHRIQEISITDGLTGLYNRRYINSRLEEIWARAVRHGEPITIILSDIDDFKSINDTYGHDKGDEAICTVARIFRNEARKEDLVARYGGEEFLIVLANTDSQQTLELAERIGEAAREHNYPWADRNITLSIGIATYPTVTAVGYLDLVRLADQAMYQAKTGGKDKVVVYGEASVDPII